MQKLPELPDAVIQILTKTVIPALIGISITLASKMREKAISKREVVASIIIGLGLGLLTGPYLHKHLSPELSSIAIGSVTMVGEKVTRWVIFKLDVDRIGEAVTSGVVSVIEFFFKRK